jgi:hypothetical protein
VVHCVYLLKLSTDLGGFRIATRPWLLGGWREGLRALESAAAEATQVLMQVPHAELARPPKPSRELRPPRVGPREGCIDTFCVHEALDCLLVVTRAVLPFRWWPCGAWVVFTAFRSTPLGPEPVTDQELDELW